jgi:hypothetical protein
MSAVDMADLVTFARYEVQSADIEPWAEVIAAAGMDAETALWVVKLYNASDDLGTAFRIFDMAPLPRFWTQADRDLVARLPLSGERRNLRGGKILRHLDSYVAALDGQPQTTWVREAVPPGTDRFAAFLALMPYLRRVWGTGRLSAFEWAEFIHKVAGLELETVDACLWESSGPRESLQLIYGAPRPGQAELDRMARRTKDTLDDAGVPLSWWDFETVICDFNVMRKGRYYPGKHLAMLREEIEGLPERHRAWLGRAYRTVVPAPWCDIPAGVDKELCRAYRETGQVLTPLSAAAGRTA